MVYDATIRNDEDSLMLLMKSEKAHEVVQGLNPEMRVKFHQDGKFFKLKVPRDYRKNLQNFCKLHELSFEQL
jgi:hypothetical protein